MNTKSLLILSALTLILPISSKAQGLLGEQFAEISYQFGDVENIDLWGLQAGVNMPAITEGTFGMDGTFSISHAEVDEEGASLKGKELDLGVNFFSMQSEVFRPFVGLKFGYGDISLFGYHESSFIYQLGVGAEIIAKDGLSITPYFRYVDITKFANGSEEYVGVKLSKWVSETVNLGIGFETFSVGDIRGEQFTGSFRIRY